MPFYIYNSQIQTMKHYNSKVDLYLADGCGRCAYYATPNCKVKNWKSELEVLRDIVLDCGLTEELKWSVPVYTHQNKNIVIVSAFKEYCSLSFFKGVLLKDPAKILESQGSSSQSARLIKFTESKAILKLAPVLKEYVKEAIKLEEAGEKVIFKKNLEPVPEELENKFKQLPLFKKAFYALTPSKQRGYIIYFSQPKQSKTRESRIENCIQKILNGKGINDRY
jgi:uncharacterized protein YdeI (YjbR/CyaY-like superfamily)